MSGIVDKNTVGNSSGGIVHLLWMEIGPEAARLFLSRVQVLVNNYLLVRGFSIGIMDTIVDEKTTNSVQTTLMNAKEEVAKTIREARSGTMKLQPGRGLMETFEHKVNEILNKSRDDAGKYVLKALKGDNNLRHMINAGSKGSNLNISQIGAVVGQQNVEGRRINFGFQRRTLPHFHKDDYSPESRGFVENSYFTGLTPTVCFVCHDIIMI